MSETSLRELSADELDLVAGGQLPGVPGLIGGPGSLIDITTTGEAVVNILTSGLAPLLEGLMLVSAASGQTILGVVGLKSGETVLGLLGL